MTFALAWTQGSCSVLSLFIAKLEIGKHIRHSMGVKVCYAPVKICQAASARNFSRLRRTWDSGKPCCAPPWCYCRKDSGSGLHACRPGSRRPGKRIPGCVCLRFRRTWGTGSIHDAARHTCRPRTSYLRARRAPGLPPAKYRGPMYGIWAYSAIGFPPRPVNPRCFAVHALVL